MDIYVQSIIVTFYNELIISKVLQQLCYNIYIYIYVQHPPKLSYMKYYKIIYALYVELTSCISVYLLLKIQINHQGIALSNMHVYTLLSYVKNVFYYLSSFHL